MNIFKLIKNLMTDTRDNTGDYNTGIYNTGIYNTGICNTGDFNTGNRNTGFCNTGNRNTGFCNTGNRNTGHYNTGDYNTGDCNTGNRNTGIFNTNEPKMRSFNKECDMTYSEFREQYGYKDIQLPITAWRNKEDMTDKEKSEVSGWETMGGYLKTLSYTEAWAEAWSKATEEQKGWYLSLPNFDAKIFEEITGINVDSSGKKEELLKKADELVAKAEELKAEAKKL